MNKITYSAPGRIDLSGGATDWCGFHTLALGINLRAYATVSKLDNPDEIEISIGDLYEKYTTPEYGTSLDLFKAVIELSGLSGFKVEYKTDIPRGSGLGGSAPLTVATLFALNNLFKMGWSKYYMAELAQRSETLKLETVQGAQDQYTATFGGLIFMDFNGKECQVGQYSKPINEEPYAVVEDLTKYLPEFFITIAIPQITRTGSGETNGSVSDRYLLGEEKIIDLMKKKAKLTQEAKKTIIEDKQEDLYSLINQNNQIMREFGFLTENNEEIIRIAEEVGIKATKTTGAGRGAVALFSENAELQNSLVAELEKHSFIKHIFKVEKADEARKEI